MSSPTLSDPTVEHAEQEWLAAYVRLALRVARQATAGAGGGFALLDYRGPAAWRDEVTAEEPPPPGRLVEEVDRLAEGLAGVGFAPARAAFLAAHVRSLATVAWRLAGERLPLPDYARGCLGIAVEPVPVDELEAAHDRLAAALPGTRGSVAERLHAWRDAHRVPPAHLDRLPDLVLRADAEARARTSALVPLPDDETVDCQLVSGVAFHAAGAHHGGTRSTIYVNRDVPLNAADLLYVVAHEGHPGHIAESVLKELHLAGGRSGAEPGGPAPAVHETQARFLVSPQFVISEGLGLAAEALAFPGDEAQAWLADNVLGELGLPPDDSDLAAVHEARNVLYGAWANAVLLLGDGAPTDEVRAYLARWALLRDDELALLGPDLDLFRAPYAEPYVLAYYHGWRIVQRLLAAGDRRTAARRLLTEQVLPA
ncbi:MAG TPA: hypothetical protein VIL48_22905 [Acidimicrobiales bacterium]